MKFEAARCLAQCVVHRVDSLAAAARSGFAQRVALSISVAPLGSFGSKLALNAAELISQVKRSVSFENTSETEPLVCLRYFGPEVNPDAPAMGAYRKNKVK